MTGEGDGVLITGVFGSGKSSVAAEITYLLQEHDSPYAFLDLDFLGWVPEHDMGYRVMLRNLAAIAPNFRDEGIDRFVLAYFVRDVEAVRSIRQALGVPLRVVRLVVPQPEIERRLTADITSGRQDDLRDAIVSLEQGEGVGVEDIALDNDRPIGDVARDVMARLGWP